jgi:hypothetical protein
VEVPLRHTDLREQIERLAPTFACWDVLEFVATTRPVGVSVENIARQIGRSVDDTRPAIAHLVRCGVLGETASGPDRYTFDPPPEVAADVARLIDALADSSGRLFAVTAVLQLDARPASADSEPRGPLGGAVG